MFFYIGDNPPFVSLEKVANRLYLDKGWANKDSIYFKGYSTDCKLSESLHDILQGYQPAGKWCVIYNNKVYHPKLRGFPLYELDNQLTNIRLDKFNFLVNKVDIPSHIQIISIDEASKIIGDFLLENTKNFFKYNEIEKLNVLFSGGLDTLTSWAVLDTVTKNYVFDVYVPNLQNISSSFFENMGRIREYQSDLMDKVSQDNWGYSISSFYKNNNWYLTGFYAEVIQFRDVTALNALANYQGKNITEFAEPDDYLYWFLKRPSFDKFKNTMLKFDSDQLLKNHLYDAIFYDYQMWHFDNNMTFNPFFDTRIADTMMNLSIADITKNALNGIIQKKIVERFNPQLLSILADYKNEKRPLDNFRKNFKLIKLDPKVELNIR